MDRWEQVDSLFHGALERPLPERDAWLRQACGSDPDLLREVGELVAHHRDTPQEDWAAAAAARLVASAGARSPGSRIGPYEIVALIGAGGMGEVYRARDRKLNRDVALKVLPAEFAGAQDRLARFTREAQLLAALNHPNIAAIYGVEEHALVMEMVEGQTMADRISHGRLSLPELLSIARQTAEGLEYAHERGIVHRDLKPANIKLTPDGRVKLLDFGLAKALVAEGNSAAPASSPTLTLEATRAGAIMGTAAYMSPEQARGSAVDKRADIWSFGVVLYEMLTGCRAFDEDTVQETLAAVLKTDPDWTALPAGTPVPLRRLLRRCLERDPRHRLRDIGDAVIEIEEALVSPETGLAIPAGNPARQKMIPWVLAALAAALASAAIWAEWVRPRDPRPIVRWTAALNLAAASPGVSPGPSLSPDGKLLAYFGASSRNNPWIPGIGHWGQIYIRPLDQFEAKPVTGTDPVDYAPFFFSPDSQWIVYHTLGTLKKVPTAGGEAVVLAPGISSSLYSFGGTWGPDGRIIFGSSAGGLSLVHASGGQSEILTKVDPKKGELLHAWPCFLPGGKAVLFCNRTSQSWDDARIEVLTLENRERRVLIEGGTYPSYAPTGHLIFERGGNLFALPFDLRKLQVKGSPVPVVQGVHAQPGSGFALYSISGAGDLVYVRDDEHLQRRTLVWVNRKGAIDPLPAPPKPYSNPALSPDGRQIAVNVASGSDQDWDIWVYDIARDTLNRRTLNASNVAPSWSPDGQHIAFRRVEGNRSGLSWIPSDGNGSPEPLLTTNMPSTPTSWSLDGKALLFYQGLPLGTDAWMLPLPQRRGEPEPKPLPLIQGRASTPQLSPDGRWIAYSSVESMMQQIYIQPYPPSGAKYQISTEGGNSPRWARNGRELFFRRGDDMLAVDIETRPVFRFGTPKVLFTGSFESSPLGMQPGLGYDVSADGKRFLMVRSPGPNVAGQIEVVHNWFEELRRRVPVN
jgi:serine/threonine-protein kinase